MLIVGEKKKPNNIEMYKEEEKWFQILHSEKT